MTQFIKVTINGETRLMNLSCIYSIYANPDGGCTIITNYETHVNVAESMDELCEALDDVLC